jgi:serralysin
LVDGSTEVRFDSDGGGDNFQTLVVLQGVDLIDQQGSALIV